MNNILVKSFDNLMLQQNKMDNKAYIFIGFIAVIITYLSPDKNSLNNITFFLLVLSIPFIISLIPIANKISISFISLFLLTKEVTKINIFYYIDIYKLSYENLLDIIKKEYGINTITNAESYLIKQILINAKILKIKVLWHNLSFILILLYFLYRVIKLITNII